MVQELKKLDMEEFDLTMEIQDWKDPESRYWRTFFDMFPRYGDPDRAFFWLSKSEAEQKNPQDLIREFHPEGVTSWSVGDLMKRMNEELPTRLKNIKEHIHEVTIELARVLEKERESEEERGGEREGRMFHNPYDHSISCFNPYIVSTTDMIILS